MSPWGSWVKKVWCTHTHTGILAIKKNEIMPFAATWMSLEIIIPSEVINLTVIKRERKGEEGII